MTSPSNKDEAAKTSKKRSKRTRWEEQEDLVEDKGSKRALNDIVKKLSGVVKEKATDLSANLQPPVLSAAVALGAVRTPHQSSYVPLPSTTKPSTELDPIVAAARAKALAQANLLAMNLPNIQPSTSDLALQIYVGNLYYALKESDIRNVFAPFGTIRSIDLSTQPGSGHSKGFCFVEYEDVLAAESAVQVLNGSELANRAIKVGRPFRGSHGAVNMQKIGEEAIRNVQTRCVYVGSVRIELNSHHLESIFAPFGKIKTCVMTAVSPLESKTHRGYGFIEFEDEASAMRAIQNMNHFELAGQKLKVGKASASAIAINLCTSLDKVIHSTSPSKIVAVEAQKVDSLAREEDMKITSSSRQELMQKLSRQSRCVLLLNLVSKGEVDAELEAEVADECRSFGSVERVEIKELEHEVRVFVVFEQLQSAIQAQKSLHGRFFGGNQIEATFYDVNKLIGRKFH